MWRHSLPQFSNNNDGVGFQLQARDHKRVLNGGLSGEQVGLVVGFLLLVENDIPEGVIG